MPQAPPEAGSREALLDQLAQALERDPKHDPDRASRIMNLPTWSGRADLVALSVRRLPQGYNPAWFGYLIGTHHRASTLAWLIDHGETSVKEIAPETIGPNIRMLGKPA